MTRSFFPFRRFPKCAMSKLNTPSSLLLARVIAAGSAIVTSPIIAQAVGAEGRGLVAAALTVLAIVPIALALGLPWAVRRRCAVNSDDQLAVLRTANLFSLGLLFPAILVGYILCATILSDLSLESKLVLMAGLALTPLVVSRNCQYSYLVVRSRFHALFLSTVSQPIFILLSVILSFSIGKLTVTVAIFCSAFSVVLSYLTTVFLVRLPLWGPVVPLGSLARESLASAGAQIAEIASYRLNQLILLPVIGAASLGNYAVGINLAMAPAPVGQAMGSATFFTTANAGPESTHDIVKRTLRAAVSLASLVAAFIAVACPLVIPLAFGQQFQPAIHATQILCLGSVFVIANYTITSNLIALGCSARASAAQYTGFLVGLITVLSLGFYYGLYGAAVGSVVGFLATSVVGSVLVKAPASAWMPTVSGAKDGILILQGKLYGRRG